MIDNDPFVCKAINVPCEPVALFDIKVSTPDGLETALNLKEKVKGSVPSKSYVVSSAIVMSLEPANEAALSESKKPSLYNSVPVHVPLCPPLMSTAEPFNLHKETRLLSGVNIDVNRHQHQRFKNEVQVCGRHTVIRSLFHFFTNDEYNSLVIAPLIKSRQVCDADTLVSLMTVFLSKSDEVVRMFFADRTRLLQLGREPKHTSLPSKNIGLGGGVV